MGALGVPYGAVATGFRFGTSEVGKLFNQISESVRRAPVRFGLVEGSMALSAASAAATAEGLFPGNVGARMGAELVGGAVNPAKLVRGAGEYTWNLARNAVQSLSPRAHHGIRKTAGRHRRQDRRGSGHDLQGLQGCGCTRS